MATESIHLEIEERTVIGKKVKALRRTGVTPMNLYGSGMASAAIQADTRELQKVLAQAGRSRPLQISIQNGDQHTVFVRDINFHPVSGEILHVDLFRVDASSVVRVEVPVRLHGESLAVRNAGGLLVQNTLTVFLEAKPMDVPDFVYVDISVLETFEDSIRVSDLPTAEGIKVTSDPASIVATVNKPRVSTGQGSSDLEEIAPSSPEPQRISDDNDSEADSDGSE